MPFLYAMFARFIMKFSDECGSFRCNIQHFLVMFMLVHLSFRHVMLVGIVMLKLY
jgi:hypothetical protein